MGVIGGGWVRITGWLAARARVAETPAATGEGVASEGIGGTIKACGPGAVVFSPAGLDERFGPGTAFPRLFQEGMDPAGALASSVVVPCVAALTFATQEMRLRVVDAHTNGPVEHRLDTVFAAPTLALGRLFGHPARFVELSQADLLARIMTYAAIGGAAYVEKVVTGRRLAGLQVHHRFGVERDGQSGRVVAVRRPNGTWDDIEHRDVMVLKWPVAHPTDEGIGLAPAEALLQELGMDRLATQFARDLLRDDGIPFQGLKLPPGCVLDPEQRAAVKDEFARRAGRRGELAVLENGAEFVRPGLTLGELDLERLYRIPESRGPACFRVPAPIAGLGMGVENSTYSNYAEARQAFTEGTVAPLAANWGAAFDAGLRSEGWVKAGQRVVLDCSEMAAMQELRRKRDTAAREDYLAGVITLAEARAAMGWGNAGRDEHGV